MEIKAKCGKEIDLCNYPSLSKWLVVVGIAKESAEVIEKSVNTLEDLKAKTDADLERYIKQVSISRVFAFSSIIINWIYLVAFPRTK